jgi:sugar-specific transcriptional regulator TrmB
MLNKIQKEQIESGLLQLGFSEKESEVYLSILQNNESSILTIARDSGLSRGTAYDIVEHLKSKGLVAEIKKGKKRRLVAESPTNSLYSILDQKHERLERSKQAVENILPLIKAIDAHSDFKPQVRIYTGEKGFRRVWDEILSSGVKEFLSIARIETFVKFAGEEFLDEIVTRKVKAGISSRAINEDSLPAKNMQAKDKSYDRETRIAPKEFQFPSTEIIFGDKIAMFSTQKENIILVIESKEFSDTHRAYFEMLWKFLEKR